MSTSVHNKLGLINLPTTTMAEQKYSVACEMAKEALVGLLVNGKTKASGREMLEWVRVNHSEHVKAVERSWSSFLTHMLTDPESSVTRVPNQYGFMLRQPEPAPQAEAPVEAVVADPAQVARRAQREKRLYSLLVEWLNSWSYQAQDTSQSKKGGPWGNPDVVGIRTHEGLGGSIHLELASIEAKISEFDWRRVFFEAVSHKRFADRAFFAFAFGTDQPTTTKLPDLEMLREYGEKYRVGILVVFMEPALHKLLRSAQETEIPDISLDMVRVEEVWPAMYDPVPISMRERFLREVLEIGDMKALHTYGT